MFISGSHVVFQPNGHILVRDYAVGDSAQVSSLFFFFQVLVIELPTVTGMLRLETHITSFLGSSLGSVNLCYDHFGPILKNQITRYYLDGSPI